MDQHLSSRVEIIVVQCRIYPRFYNYFRTTILATIQGRLCNKSRLADGNVYPPVGRGQGADNSVSAHIARFENLINF